MQRITTYNPLPVEISHGKGCWLYDTQGRAYLDSFSGIAVCALGHAHPAITETIQTQAAKVIHTSNMLYIKQQQQLAEKLCQITGMTQAFFGNSGAEANEAALKLARLYGHQRNIAEPAVIVMEKAFHGRTLATLSASGSPKVQAGFEPLVTGFVRVPFNDFAAVEQVAQTNPNIVAVLVEPIQGESGIHLGDPHYFQKLSSFCKEKNWLLMLDEVQTGNGRTGHWYCYLDYGFKPDVITTAKGLGNGMPIGACLMSGPAENLFAVGNHGSTFGGNPLACATAITVLDVIEREGLCQNATDVGSYLKDQLIGALQHHSRVKEIRGKGLMIGVELTESAMPLRMKALEQNLFISVTADSVIRLTPPLILTRNEADMIVERISTLLNS